MSNEHQAVSSSVGTLPAEGRSGRGEVAEDDEAKGAGLRLLGPPWGGVGRCGPPRWPGDSRSEELSRTSTASTYILALWLEGRAGRWELTERGERDGVLRWWTKLSLEPEPGRLEEAKASAEAIVGPCVWLDRGSLSVGPWTVVSAVGRPAAATR
jgi:hypothetical protein